MKRESPSKRKRETPRSVLARIPGWEDLPALKTKALGGLTNQNHLITTSNGKFVLRISRENAPLLGIDRKTEQAALKAAARLGVGPKVVKFLFPEGHLLTRYIQGRRWPVEEYRQPANLRRVVKIVKRIHDLPAIPGTFSPFRRVESYALQVREAGLALPEDFDDLLEKMRMIETRQAQDDSAWLKFCHNDLFSVNFLDDGDIRILDWEFAGMGDLYFDLATLVYAYDREGPLPYELEEFLLECYFGTVRNTHRIRLRDMEFMVNLFSAMWGMLNLALVRQGSLPPVKGFDYLGYSQSVFNGALKVLKPGEIPRRKLFQDLEQLL